MFPVVHRMRHESALSRVRRPSGRRILAPSCAKTALRREPRCNVTWGIGTADHDSCCAESCAKSCNRGGLILPSRPGSFLPSAAGHEIDVYTYLVDVLQRVGQHPAARVAELTPRLWKQHFAAKPLRSALHTLAA